MTDPDKRSDLSWEDRCELEAPFIEWRAPQEEQYDGRRIFACRFCLVQYGLTPETVHQYSETKTEFIEHMRAVHGREPGESASRTN